MRAELEVANLVLQLLDDKKDRTYGCTCGDLTVGAGASEEPLEPVLRGLFVAARGTLTNRPVETRHGLNLFNIGCINAAGRSLQGLVSLVEDAREARGWAVLVIHGIGAGTHDLYLETDVHAGFIQWLGQQKQIWTAPVRTVATFLRDRVAPS